MFSRKCFPDPFRFFTNADVINTETNYLKMMELYWHNKTFIAKLMEEKGTQHLENLNKLDQLDQKSEALINTI
jgi:hypothetical protein